MSNSVSLSSIEVGVVPDGNTMSETYNKPVVEEGNQGVVVAVFLAADREARVLWSCNSIFDFVPCKSLPIASELRGKRQESRRSSSAKEEINVVQSEQCKQLLQSGKHKA